MTFQPRPNASGDTLAASRDQIRTNFEIIRDDFAINHIGFDEANEGKHSFLQMPEQSSDPATAANEIAIYSKEGVGPAEANLFLRDENSGGAGGNVYQMSRTDDTNFATFGTNTNYSGTITGGWTFLAGGMLLSYGIGTTSGTGNPNCTITFPKSYTNTVYSIVCTPILTANSRRFISVYDRSNTQFRAVVRDSGGTPVSGETFFWQVIGV